MSNEPSTSSPFPVGAFPGTTTTAAGTAAGLGTATGVQAPSDVQERDEDRYGGRTRDEDRPELADLRDRLAAAEKRADDANPERYALDVDDDDADPVDVCPKCATPVWDGSDVPDWCHRCGNKWAVTPPVKARRADT